MSNKLKKTGTNSTRNRHNKKQINTNINDITEQTRQTVLETFTDEQLAEFRELFDMFDKDNQG